MGSNTTTTIVLVLIVAGVILFAVITAITGRKNQRLEKNKRKKTVKVKIKAYLKEHYKINNCQVEYEKVVARKGKEYKYRDIFDVLVDIYEPRSHELLFSKAFEIEGISHKIDKKKIETDWTINGELDYEKTKHNIKILEGKIKLDKKEAKIRKMESKKKFADERKRFNVKRKNKDGKAKPPAQKFNPRG